MRKERITDLTSAALEAHAGQTDKQGAPYSEHLLRVADAVSDAAKPVALFHDSIEDRRIGLFELRRLLESDELTAVLLLTRRDMRYSEYIHRLRLWPGRVGELAREVKIADLRDNLGQLGPRAGQTPVKLRPRYEHALEVLTEKRRPG